MPFDIGKFERADFKPRTSKVPVPALADFFDEGEEPDWEVRQLSATELYNAMEAKSRRSGLEAVVAAISASGSVGDAVRAAIGLTKDAPGEIVKRMEMLVTGSVKPKIELPIAVKMAEKFPIEFMQITNEITVLTGKGAEMVKPEAASPKIEPSESA